jgi:hypothetical protein
MPVALLGPSGRIILDGPVYTLGSAFDNQIVLTDLKASPRHASLQLQGQSYSLTDLGSADGTYLNDQRIFPHSSAFLKNADKIRIGNTVYTYEESLVSSPSYPSYDPTVLASNSPAYDATILASQTPPPSPFTGYGQGGAPSSPNYPPAAPPTPAYGQSAPGYPLVTPAPAYGQGGAPSSPNYPPAYDQSGTPSSPNYPPAAPPAPGYGQGGVPSAPNYPPAYGQGGAPSAPNYPPAAPPAPGYGQSAPGYPSVPPTQAYGQSSAPGYPPYTPPTDPYAPAQPGFVPTPGQPQQPWGASLPPGYQAQPPKKKGGCLKVALILIVIVVVIVGGLGVAGYILSRPKPVITLTSTYTTGITPVGATDTSFHVGGTDFSGNSVVTFLLDGTALPGGQTALSDSDGVVSATLSVTSDWAVGNHTLTARDASGYLTKAGQALTIVTQGDDKTPGPSGAPTNSASGTISTTGLTQSGSFTLTVTGDSDAGGKVCRAEDDGQPQTSSGTSSGSSYTETATATCSGTYDAGKLTYTETITSDKAVFDDGEVCIAPKPYVAVQLSGTFTSATAINGTYTEPAVPITCSLDGQSETVTNPASSGNWSGIASMG